MKDRQIDQYTDTDRLIDRQIVRQIDGYIYIDRYIDKNDFVTILAQTWAWLNNDH